MTPEQIKKLYELHTARDTATIFGDHVEKEQIEKSINEMHSAITAELKELFSGV